MLLICVYKMPHTKDYELLGGTFRNFNFIAKFVFPNNYYCYGSKSLHAAIEAQEVSKVTILLYT